MVVLDTDHMTAYERATSPEGQRLHARLGKLPDGDKTTTIISYEEQVRGWTAILAQARTVLRQIDAYRRLKKQLENYCSIAVLEFDERDATEFQRLRGLRLRIGTMDLKIAAIALAHDATLLSRNLRDFRRVPRLKVEDWTS